MVYNWLTQSSKFESDESSQWTFFKNDDPVCRPVLSFQCCEECGLLFVHGFILRQDSIFDS